MSGLVGFYSRMLQKMTLFLEFFKLRDRINKTTRGILEQHTLPQSYFDWILQNKIQPVFPFKLLPKALLFYFLPKVAKSDLIRPSFPFGTRKKRWILFEQFPTARLKIIIQGLQGQNILFEYSAFLCRSENRFPEQGQTNPVPEIIPTEIGRIHAEGKLVLPKPTKDFIFCNLQKGSEKLEAG